MRILITGKSETGKTLSAKKYCEEFTRKGMPVMVLTPMGDRSQWKTKYVYDDKDKFLRIAKNNKRCLLIVDEPEEILGKCLGAQDKKYLWLSTQSRHRGHSLIMICQRPQQVNPTMRAQCSRRLIFQSSRSDSDMFNNELSTNCDFTKLKQFEFIYIKDNFTEPVKMKVKP